MNRRSEFWHAVACRGSLRFTPMLAHSLSIAVMLGGRSAGPQNRCQGEVGDARTCQHP